MTKREKITRILCVWCVVLFLVAVIAAAYMISQNMGQVPGIDFGPGQYYYTDIPGWQKYFLGNHYENQVPMSVLIGLFFLWGFLMYGLWSFLDRKL